MSTALVGGVVAGHTLAENEAVIRRNLTSFVEVGNALMEIRDEGQYVDAGFDSFEDYCKARFDMAVSTAGRYIGGARVVHAIESASTRVVAPATLEHAKPLIPLWREEGDRAVVTAWEAIVSDHKGEDELSQRDVRRFFQVKRQANYGTKAGWHELIGVVGDTLTKASADLAKFETAVGSEDPGSTKAKAARYAAVAEDIATRLREIAV